MRQLLAYPVMIASFLVPVLGEPAMIGSLKMVVTLATALLALKLQPAYDPKAETAADRGTARAFAALVVPFNALTMLEARWRVPDSMDWGLAAFLAVAMVAGGLALRTWAVRTLGRFFTLHVAVTAEQPLIREGPYKYVRHPAYTGALLFLLGAPLLWNAWITLAVGAVAFGAWFRARIRQEEKVLVEAKGRPYEDYIRTTPALLPKINS